MKRCNKCNIEKSLEEFYKHKATKDKRQPTCKKCWNTRNKKEYYSVYLLTEDIPYVGYTDNVYQRMHNHRNKGRIKDVNSYRVLHTTKDRSDARELEDLLHDIGYVGRNHQNFSGPLHKGFENGVGTPH